MARISKTRKLELADIDLLMSLPEGQRFISRLLQSTGVVPYVQPFIPGGLEGDRATSFNCGRRSVGLTIQSDIMEACPEKYINLMRSSKARREKEEEEREHIVEEGEELV